MKKYIMEFIGTFFLMLSIVLAVNSGLGLLAPIAIGAMLVVMVFAGGHISSAHYNPAVTLALVIRGKCEIKDVPGYMISQFIGAVLAVFIAGFLLGDAMPTEAPAGLDILPALVAELLGTFALAFVILSVATAKKSANNSFYGLAIGLTVTACAYALGGFSGGAFNPAVALGISIAKMSAWSNIWIFLVANFSAGALAAIVFRIVSPEDHE